ncbi:MAG TPA: alpha-glucan family phosphorylase [Bacteroidota bacterium]|nr:alpha-glucan family phosphorylase [Bacteroidota bacterium]
MTRPIQTYTVDPSIPPGLECLLELAHNLAWVWDTDLMELFIRLDPDIWEQTQHNPVRLLGTIKQERLNSAARDEAYLAQVERGYEKFKKYREASSCWFKKTYGEIFKTHVAYFSAEFGLTECLPNYSGGLGILSGDHLKAASDLGIPLVGVGLLYQQGYFRQYLNVDGFQQERYPENDFYTLPIELQRDQNGKPITVSCELPGRSVTAQLWLVRVGRAPLYLLDANIPQNSRQDQKITDQLYGGDREMRMMQEVLLGIGGYRALKALGLDPGVYHMNEGHSSFLSLERCRDLMKEQKLSFSAAREAASAGIVFTTHTPVPAGNDFFTPDLMSKYFSSYRSELGISEKEFLGLGRENPDNLQEHFCMTVLALRMAGKSNAVSRLHGKVSRSMWKNVWPRIPVDDLPIISITNGTHGPSWISRDMAGLYDRYLGPRWRDDGGDLALWSRVNHIPDEELWRTHERRRERLVAFARARLRDQLAARGAPAVEVERAKEVLNSEALTIGFGRRFATYKRATLILRDAERLTNLLTNKERPVQILFTGKAHPLDNPGKDLIRQIIHFERLNGIRNRMVFLEDYDMVVGRYMVQGVDVWLNTPRRPLEASGTSGMKAALNGAINLSILDGWWDEAYNATTGWAIGKGEEYTDEKLQDDVESNALYDLLEKEIVPLFYKRGADDLPREWISKMKGSMRTIGPQFNTNRMVREYMDKMYLTAQVRSQALRSEEFKKAKELAAWKERVSVAWDDIELGEVIIEKADKLKVGESVTVRASIELGDLTPADVFVDLWYGVLNAKGNIEQPKLSLMKSTGKKDGSNHEYVGTITMETSGRLGHTIRILPRHEDLDNPNQQGLIVWAEAK